MTTGKPSQLARQRTSVGLRSPSYYTYSVGVVVHTGTADAGHYYSFAKGDDEKWFEFNDRMIRLFNPDKYGEQMHK